MHNLLSTRRLIARMTPTALAETIASIEQCESVSGYLDLAERDTIACMRKVLANNVGDEEAAKLIEAAR
jgi:hypothetical protein